MLIKLNEMKLLITTTRTHACKSSIVIYNKNESSLEEKKNCFVNKKAIAQHVAFCLGQAVTRFRVERKKKFHFLMFPPTYTRLFHQSPF